MPSPFDKKDNTATAARPVREPSPKDDLPDDVTNVGEDTPLGKGDPFAGNPADPMGISGYKPLFFMNQLVLMHPTETGWMKTTSNTPENPQSEYVRFDIIPLTVPESFEFINKDGETETCEPYEAGERIDDVLVFNKPLVREGKKALDNGTAWLLGRIVYGSKKPGQSRPVILVAGDEDDKVLYQQWRKEAMAKK